MTPKNAVEQYQMKRLEWIDIGIQTERQRIKDEIEEHLCDENNFEEDCILCQKSKEIRRILKVKK